MTPVFPATAMHREKLAEKNKRFLQQIVPQVALVHAENVLEAHEIFLGHLEVGRTKANITFGSARKRRQGSALHSENQSLPREDLQVQM